jgi:hypothetical protein
MSNTQLVSAPGNYDTGRMLFSKCETNTVPNSSISYKRININSRNADGTVGELVLGTPRLFSFGVSENTDPATGKVNGYTMPLCLYTKDAPRDEEKQWVDGFNRIIEAIKDHVLANREEIGKYELEPSDLKKMNPLYWKKEKGKIVEGQGPVLYAKLIERKKDNKILSVFYDDSTGEEIEALSLIGKYCYANAAIKIESIYVGNKVTVQVKLYEASVQQQAAGPKRLLGGGGMGLKKASEEVHHAPMMHEDDEPEHHASSSAPTRQAPSEDIQDDDDEPQPPKPAVSAPVRKTIPSKKK